MTREEMDLEMNVEDKIRLVKILTYNMWSKLEAGLKMQQDIYEILKDIDEKCNEKFKIKSKSRITER